jgi:hypothetical protein
MSCPTPETQQTVGDRLLYEGWHAKQISNPGQPESRWVLHAPTGRVRLTMVHDLAEAYAEVAAADPSGPTHAAPLWQVIAYAVPAATLLAVARTAEDTAAAGSVVDARRDLARLLRRAGWACDKNRAAQARAARAVWSRQGDTRTATWTTPGRRGSGGWEISGSGMFAIACPRTPAPLLHLLAEG